MQRVLFPDGYEVQAEALVALEELDLVRGRERLEEARRRALDAADVETVGRAIEWLEQVLGGDRDGDAIARAFLAVPKAALTESVKEFVERVVARAGLRRSSGAFLDGERRVPRAALELALGQSSGLRKELSALVACEPRRADLRGWLAEACLRDERAEEAKAELVRALLLDADRVDFHRLRTPPLAALATLLAELCAAEPEPRARELVLPHGWLRGLLAIPPENGWLEGELARLRARAAHPKDPAARARAFALLLYEDRSRRPVEADESMREAMAALEPELFRRFMAVLGARGGKASPGHGTGQVARRPGSI